MQQTIGERLQQARQRLGLSLDEVAEKLKIRKALLLKFESNEFATNLPMVYARGFFRTYVNFLKLNEASFLAEYSELVGDNPKPFTLGRLQIESSELKHDAVEPEITEMDGGESSAKFVKPVWQFVYFKLLLGLCGLLLIFGLVSIFWPKKEKIASENVSVMSSEKMFEDSADNVYEEITLVALDAVQVFVRQESNKRRLFVGTLNKGERRSMAKEDVLQISFSEGNNLLIERSNGTSIRPQKSGRGWIRLQ